MAYAGTTEVLAGNATWASNVITTDRADTLTAIVFSDQAGTIYIEQSGDGKNWDLSTSTPVVANTGKGISDTLYGPYVRLRFVNGALAQTTFRVAARLASAGDS